MSNPTSNFGWQMPTATDLVTDLPADFEVFGQAVDTDFADLNGGTTGQLLSKTSATDLDFTWVTPNAGDITDVGVTTPITGGGSSGAVTIGIQDALTTQKGAVQLSDSTSTTSSILAATPTAVKSAYDLANGAIPKTLTTTTGDSIYASAANTPARLGIGSTGQVLTVAGGVPSWATPSGSGESYTLISTTRMLSVGGSVTFSSLGSYNSIYVTIETLATTGSGATLYLKCNASSTAADYTQAYIRFTNNNTFSSSFLTSSADMSGNSNGNPLASYGSTASPTLSGYFKIEGAKAANPKLIPFVVGASSNASNPNTVVGCSLFNGAAISSINLRLDTGVFNDGYIRIYGSTI
jgi:hypothetical protein